ncbi:phage baseplate assembly protein V [Hymenobacter tibetensis]|uniref:Phage baseplate assembly protein V n=1 Tax=Hymenobacter tibetensis TaxID=497967 RepID=A0ABY4CVB3_9BACT|nr:phage baseplate assembly protein V [Hymenobacter tibetensis]UOG74200.1 phage baseplate assembly protein V [Hymenobacter tibetensis]
MARQVTATVQCAGTPLAPAPDIQHLVLHQDLFGHHHFEIAVPFDNVEGPQEAFFSKAHKRLLGQPLNMELTADAFHFNQGQVFKFKGLVTNIATSKDTDYVGSIIVRGYSPNYLLTDGLKRRTFVKQTLSSIFSKVLQVYPGNMLKHSIKPVHTAPIAFVAQYDETNFDFLSRLATEYGEWFYYDGETLQLGAPAAGTEQDFIADGVYNSFTFGMALRPAKVKMYEYSYQKNEKFKSSTSSQQVPGISGHPFGSFALEQSEKLFTDELHISAEMLIASASELDEEAKMLKANTAAELITFEGHSDNPALRVGGVINVSGEGLGSRHITAESFGKYRIISISHYLDAEGNYSNSFTAIPHFLNVPPVRPGYNPPAGTPELAEVIDDADPQKLGRLRVRYHWPVSTPADAETDWIRLLTPYSGDGKGQLFKPEVGSQVLVGYQNGLAEQPFVLGNMFHANNKQGAKYSPDGNLMKGLQTAGGNKFVMQDKQGEQSINISNSNNKGTSLNINFNGDGSVSISTNGPINLTAGGDITLTAKKDITLTAENVTINAKTKITKTAKEIAMTGSDKVDMKGKATTIQADNTMKIAASSSLDVNGGSKASISSGKTKIH